MGDGGSVGGGGGVAGRGEARRSLETSAAELDVASGGGVGRESRGRRFSEEPRGLATSAALLFGEGSACSARSTGYHALVSRPTEPPTTIDAFVDGGVVCRARNMVRIHWGCPLPEQHGPDAPPARRPGPGAGTVPAGSPRAPGAGAAVCGENEAR